MMNSRTGNLNVINIVLQQMLGIYSTGFVDALRDSGCTYYIRGHHE